MTRKETSRYASEPTRRNFLARSASSVLGAAVLSAQGCNPASTPGQERPAAAFRAPENRFDAKSASIREIELVTSAGEVEVAPGEIYETWLYNGEFPGPEIRISEGERLRVVLKNDLPEETTIHWHGLPVPNPMDGVPGVTQEAIPPGGAFTYEFNAAPSGTYIYHSHVGLQFDRGLVAPLIIEEKQPHVEYDRDYNLLLDDFLARAPEPLDSDNVGEKGRPAPMGGGGGMMGRMRGGMMRMMGGIRTPDYQGLLINGRLPDSAPAFSVRRGERVRFRLMNPSGATTYRFAIAGHSFRVTHTDGRPVEPVEVDSLFISMGERYDIVVDADNPGSWTMMAAPVEVQAPPARAILQYEGVLSKAPHPQEVPDGIEGGRLLQLSQLHSLAEMGEPAGPPDAFFDLTLSGGMMSTAWTIDGQAYPDADPLRIEEGQNVRVRMVNHSMMIHPMHLHGHFFRVGKVVKETVLVPPHMAEVTFDFRADHPGDWLFHCHNVYHLEAGMARVFTYG